MQASAKKTFLALSIFSKWIVIKTAGQIENIRLAAEAPKGGTMCPACYAALALILAGAASTGGLTTLVAKKIHAKTGKKEFDPIIQSKGEQNESISSSTR